MAVLAYSGDDGDLVEHEFEEDSPSDIDEVLEILENMKAAALADKVSAEIQQDFVIKVVPVNPVPQPPPPMPPPATFPFPGVFAAPVPPMPPPPPMGEFFTPGGISNLTPGQMAAAMPLQLAEAVKAVTPLKQATGSIGTSVKKSLVQVITNKLELVLSKQPGYKPPAKKITEWPPYKPKVEVFTKKDVDDDMVKSVSVFAKDPESGLAPKKFKQEFVYPINTEVMPKTPMAPMFKAKAKEMFGDKWDSPIMAEVPAERWDMIDKPTAKACIRNIPFAGVHGNLVTWNVLANMRFSFKELEKQFPGLPAPAFGLMKTMLTSIEACLKVRHNLLVNLHGCYEEMNRLFTEGRQNAEMMAFLNEQERIGCLQWGPPRQTLDTIKLPNGRVVDLT